MKRLISLFPLLLLTACSPKPASVVDRYLKDIQSGNTTDQTKLECVHGEGVDKSLIQSAPAWTVVGEQQRSDPPYNYQVVTVKIGDDTFHVRVWKTDDIYKRQVESDKKLEKAGIKLSTAGARSSWSPEEYCVSAELTP
ncbi:MAG: hypothetical protein LH702_28925 [Phormidesmis sp. CAN_BIN44]|nr:hypothetical protein [Phormidesmis sp. CAN_BIN44]